MFDRKIHELRKTSQIELAQRPAAGGSAEDMPWAPTAISARDRTAPIMGKAFAVKPAALLCGPGGIGTIRQTLRRGGEKPQMELNGSETGGTTEMNLSF